MTNTTKKAVQRWKYCYNGRNLPPVYSTRVCVFKTSRGPKLESCTLVEDLYSDGRQYWVLKGDTKQKEVFPYAWLEIDTDFPEEFFTNITILGEIKLTWLDD
jgi:hypothetical protein